MERRGLGAEMDRSLRWMWPEGEGDWRVLVWTTSGIGGGWGLLTGVGRAGGQFGGLGEYDQRRSQTTEGWWQLPGLSPAVPAAPQPRVPPTAALPTHCGDNGARIVLYHKFVFLKNILTTILT